MSAASANTVSEVISEEVSVLRARLTGQECLSYKGLLMKQCPACNRTYTDDELSFCLEDGTQLQSTGFGSDAYPSFNPNLDPNKTLAYSQPRETSPPPANVHPSAPANQTPMTPPTWSPTPSYSPTPTIQPAGKSGRGWIIGAIAAVVVLGVGIFALLAIIGKNSSTSNKSENVNSTVVNKNSNTLVVNANNTNNANRDTISTSASFLKDDFSTENWPTGESAYGSFYQDDEYHMKGKPGLYIFMFPRNSGDYTTKDASVKVTARNVDGKSPKHGYGLIINGKVTQKTQLEGYGFLIYTSAPAQYEIVRFAAGEPTPVVEWESSSVIRGGTNSNQIEVRTKGSQLSLYINGQFVKSITDTTGLTEGFAGLYTSETNEVAFDDMEIDRTAER
ncbi:MAG TPA: hypothetical protein VGN95_16265 [Pyrinomonadaceae bacterium]|jgi:hypothetical protein|nr:hypothetical protein [Pyrinomonadaceae bacterium]